MTVIYPFLKSLTHILFALQEIDIYDGWLELKLSTALTNLHDRSILIGPGQKWNPYLIIASMSEVVLLTSK